MKHSLRDLRLLLIEARKDQEMIDHELGCLARAGGVSPDQFTVFDCLKSLPHPGIINGFSAVFIGGTGDFSVAKDTPDFLFPLMETVKAALETNKPLLGLCYGFHLMAAAVGGKVVTSQDGGETGTYEVELTPAGREDPLLGFLPPKFLAQQGHLDVVTFLPRPYVCLATSRLCKYQAFKHPQKPFYGLQFHPELGRDDFMLRMRIYASCYASTPEKYEEINARVVETKNQEVIRRFLELCREERG